ncbi:MAG: hypothetical protein A2289_00670 [Deltaproteobacteria bacterium RIFOXYA12_FULL_58_15]|nr:MAG: hypothetical protein A2289_00670 [Deltaproteobacteria bacterium RIFOXYA12_FULL_58_15]OGR08535.1 MAG: hypothetical protein A2341_25315 [Deltaproteobacteria bacterium RIFOXYB12_FULL_58_9]
MSSDRVLLIDDEVDFVEALAERLRTRGLEVDVATNGEDGIAKSKSASYSAVVLDFSMPGMNGIETLRALREYNSSIRVLLLTGQATVKAAIAATRLGAVDILEKPIDIATLLEKIGEARAR